jgi:hypothetical protein
VRVRRAVDGHLGIGTVTVSGVGDGFKEPWIKGLRSKDFRIRKSRSKIKSLVAALCSEEGHVLIELYTHIHLDTDHLVAHTSNSNPDALALHSFLCNLALLILFIYYLGSIRIR